MQVVCLSLALTWRLCIIHILRPHICRLEVHVTLLRPGLQIKETMSLVCALIRAQ